MVIVGMGDSTGFCTILQTSFTQGELNETYSNGIVAVIPAHATGTMLQQDAIDGVVTRLKQSGIIPVTTDIANYNALVSVFLGNVQKEYCHYQSRYRYTLDNLFSSIQQSYTTNTPDIKAKIDTNLLKAQNFNQILNDLTQVVNAITTNMLTSTKDMDNQVKEFQLKIDKLNTQLQEQNNIITKNNASTTIKKEMVKYTEEKGRYHDNLLKLYSFLNVFTLGLLVYIYRAAE
jgi:hypothetical protein